mmetsp:Transcript_26273/g.40293  ORF Transcript_26273/g.40293 Transcript_26273/m.40293 type:complete len:675 (-) Transcript_26273:51-2075(-)
MAKTTNGGSSTFKKPPAKDLVMADTFPAKTYLMIDHCDKNDPDVACWNDKGDMFIVSDTAQLANTYLPQYFKHAKFQSFVRQLNLYGFRSVKNNSNNDSSSSELSAVKKNNGTECNSSAVIFRHDNFKKDHQKLLGQIKRAKKGESSSCKRGKTAAKTVDTNKNGTTADSAKVPITLANNGVHKETKNMDAVSMHTRLELMEVKLRDVALIHKRMEEMSQKLDLLISIMTTSNGSVDVGGGIVIKGPPQMSNGTYIIPSQPGKRRRHDVIDEETKMNSDYRPGSPVSISEASDTVSQKSETSSISSSYSHKFTRGAIVGGQKTFPTMDVLQERVAVGGEEEMQEDDFKNFIESMLDEDDDQKPSALLSSRSLMEDNDFDASMEESDAIDFRDTGMAAFQGDDSDISSDCLGCNEGQNNQMSMEPGPDAVFIRNAEESKPVPDLVPSEMESTPTESNAILMHAEVHAEAVPDRPDDYDEENGSGRNHNNDINTITAERIPQDILTDEGHARCTPFRWFVGIAILAVILVNIIVWPIVMVGGGRNSNIGPEESGSSGDKPRPSTARPGEETSDFWNVDSPRPDGDGGGYGPGGGNGPGLGLESNDESEEENKGSAQSRMKKRLFDEFLDTNKGDGAYYPVTGDAKNNSLSAYGSSLSTEMNLTMNGQSYICSSGNT